MAKWSIGQARTTYNMENWSGGYFDISDEGNVVYVHGEMRPGVALAGLVDQAQEMGLSLPILFRFSDILSHRIDDLQNAFARAREQFSYQGRYTSIYPIKVNQQHSVVQTIVTSGADRVGLEAGSKPELLAVIAASLPGNVIVCNGYKDREYIQLALVATRLGHPTYIVVEKLSELELVIEEARRMEVQPYIGVRIRLATLGVGKWQNTGGQKSKFGLTASEVLTVVSRLREAGLLDALHMLHFHMGSQIANIQDIQRGLREGAQVFRQLCLEGVDIRTVNVGGGLGIDYEGTRSRSYCSRNYSLQEYADNVVKAFASICEEHGLNQPQLYTESGRAMTAHHAVLVTNVVEVERMTAGAARADAELPPECQSIVNVLQGMDSQSLVETYHDAVRELDAAEEGFSQGRIGLAARGGVEAVFAKICDQLRARLSPENRAHREVLDELSERLVDKYFCNFSLFQSLPDVWAIQQIFPIVPLSGLQQEPDRRGVIVDITCDSDGRIDEYADSDGITRRLPLHAVTDSGYLLGIFLVGAYQEILGDMHNLFGDTDSVHVSIADGGSVTLVDPRRGDTVESVLRYVHFDREQMLSVYRSKVAGLGEVAEREHLLALLEHGLEGYTYLEA